MTGAFERNPKRRKARANEPAVTTPLGEPPEHLDEAARARWRDIAEQAPWANGSHRGAAEVTAVLWAKFRRNELTAPDIKTLMANFRLFGLTPADASKVSMPPAAPDKESLLA